MPTTEETLDPADWGELRALGHRMVDDMMDYLERVRVPRVHHLVIRLAIQQANRSGGGEPTPRRVWDDLVALVATQAGVPVQEIHPELPFGELPDYC